MRVVLLLFALVAAASAQQFAWTNCAPPDALMSVKTFSIDPFPPKTNNMMSMVVEGDLRETVADGVYDFEVDFIGITIANITGDMCDLDWVQCPLQQGSQALKQQLEVPPFLPDGPFNVTLRFNTTDGKPVFCLQFDLVFQSGGAAVAEEGDEGQEEEPALVPEVIDNNPNGDGQFISIPLTNGEFEGEDEQAPEQQPEVIVIEDDEVPDFFDAQEPEQEQEQEQQPEQEQTEDDEQEDDGFVEELPPLENEEQMPAAAEEDEEQTPEEEQEQPEEQEQEQDDAEELPSNNAEDEEENAIARTLW